MIFRAWLITILFFAVLYWIGTPSRAQEGQPCGPRDKVEKRIWTEYGESVVGAGLTPGGILYVTANLQTGTFTIILRRPDGMACVLMGGRGFAQGEPRIPGVGL